MTRDELHAGFLRKKKGCKTGLIFDVSDVKNVSFLCQIWTEAVSQM